MRNYLEAAHPRSLRLIGIGVRISDINRATEARDRLRARQVTAKPSGSSWIPGILLALRAERSENSEQSELSEHSRFTDR
jgi:hypothetical protein